MSTGQIIALVIAAVLVFWMVGAYNRLVALRNEIGRAFQQVDERLLQRGAAVAPLVAALREPLAAEQGALDALLAAQAQVRSAADALKARPVEAQLAAALVAAEAAMGSAASRLLALLDQHPALRDDETIAPHVGSLRDGDGRLVFMRQHFNDAALAYNEAAHQFPTRLLTRWFSFGAAGRL
ncbi:MAG: LemA family protein [Rubrivivax sp.]|nr:LemA family protein [Rubrivivax sp.]